MSKKVSLNAEFGYSDRKIVVGLTLLEFEEDNTIIIYSPALDLTGYGYNIQEAKDSFINVLQEFLNYSQNKKTIEKYLQKMGWKILGSKKKPKFTPPKNTELAKINPFYSDIVNNKNYSSYSQNVELAL